MLSEQPVMGERVAAGFPSPADDYRVAIGS